MLLILALAFALRIWGIQFGLPNVWCRPDEGVLVSKAMAMGTGDMNPHHFLYPSLSYYFLAALYGAYFVVGRVTGLFGSVSDFEQAYFVDASSFYLLGRIVVALLGAASVLAVHRIASRIESARAGLVAAFFLAIAFLHVRDSHFLTVDVPSTFLALISCAWLLTYLANSTLRSLLFCATFLGLATSTKYNIALFGFWPLLAPWLARARPRGRYGRGRHSLLAAVVMGTAFVAASPFIALDFSTFWRDLSYQRSHFHEGHGIDLGNDWTYHLTFTLFHGLGWPLLAMALIGCAILGIRRRPADVLLLAAILVYFAAASSGNEFVRYLVPLVPLLAIASGVAVDRLTASWGSLRTSVLVSLVALPSLWSVVCSNRLLTIPDTRLAAADWIRARVPSGSRLAIEGDHFGYPQVHRSREWLAEVLEDYIADGRDGRRVSRMLELDRYPPEPNYYVLELHRPGDPPLRSERAEYSVSMLREERVEWVVVQDHPLIYSRGDATFRETLAREGRLEAEFHGLSAGDPVPVYDPLDAYYVPYARFGAVRAPGPDILVYSLPANR